MAWMLFVTLLAVISASYVTAEERIGLCPKTQPNTAPSTVCSTDMECPMPSKCCLIGSTHACADPVIPNYIASMVFVGLPVMDNETHYLSNYLDSLLAGKGVLTAIETNRTGTCVKVHLELHTDQEDEVDTTLEELESTPVFIDHFPSGPFRVISALNESLCGLDQPVPNFRSSLYVMGVTDVVTSSEVKTALRNLLTKVGRGWYLTDITKGSCVKMAIEATLTEEEENTVMDSLDNMEEHGLRVKTELRVFSVTSNEKEAADHCNRNATGSENLSSKLFFYDYGKAVAIVAITARSSCDRSDHVHAHCSITC